MEYGSHREERGIEPINILIVFLLGIASALFIVAASITFKIKVEYRLPFAIMVGVAYLVSLFAFLKPRTKTTKLIPPSHTVEQETIHVPVEKIVEKPVVKTVEKIVEKPVIKTKTIVQPLILKEEKKKQTKYIGSSKNEKYHLRSCRYASAIKPEYMVEEDDLKYFRLRGYDPCKICNPDKKQNDSSK